MERVIKKTHSAISKQHASLSWKKTKDFLQSCILHVLYVSCMFCDWQQRCTYRKHCLEIREVTVWAPPLHFPTRFFVLSPYTRDPSSCSALTLNTLFHILFLLPPTRISPTSIFFFFFATIICFTIGKQNISQRYPEKGEGTIKT